MVPVGDDVFSGLPSFAMKSLATNSSHSDVGTPGPVEYARSERTAMP